VYNRIKSNKNVGINEINMWGGNMCGKTTAAIEFCIKCAKESSNTAVYVFRNGLKDVSQLFQSFINTLDDMQVSYSSNKDKLIKIGKGRIEFYHLRMKSESDKRRGMTNLSEKIKYCICFIDEASEVNERDRVNIEIRLRGKRKDMEFIYILTSNPDVNSNPYMIYLAQ
jgi:hypothetical protein